MSCYKCNLNRYCLASLSDTTVNKKYMMIYNYIIILLFCILQYLTSCIYSNILCNFSEIYEGF